MKPLTTQQREVITHLRSGGTVEYIKRVGFVLFGGFDESGRRKNICATPRAVRAIESAGLITRNGNRYELTDAGRAVEV